MQKEVLIQQENVLKRVKEINQKYHYDVVQWYKCLKCDRNFYNLLCSFKLDKDGKYIYNIRLAFWA